MSKYFSSQLMTLKAGSSIHIQAIVESTVGTMKGSSIIARIVFLNRNSWFIVNASANPPTIFRIVAKNV